MDQIDCRIPEVVRTPDMTTQEYAYLRLRRAIMVGAFPPGHKLTIRGLAHDLDLSQTPIREAVRRLSSESAIEVLGNRRLRIPVMTSGRFEELVRLRTALELHAALRSLPYVSDIVIDQMAEIDRMLDIAVEENDPVEMTRLNHAFHRALYCLNPDQAVMPLIESLWLQLGPFQRQVVLNHQDYYRIDRHQEILTALKTRDADALSTGLVADIQEGLVLAGKKALQEAMT
ncbi:GntR family transcriptional regulator [Celeribacter baekdonensis]|jgi:DNA-binding GntR family transcriptional regulator|uniref:GntR family transcriptional regulator n=1 Tax=Celeribacter baekdonensis TaxID=875171 RepID=A0A2R4M5C2_9RHOB|nr:GntR family transcriptional regulator [Celeribacter baekdonensis]AVW92400.1 GntR family transcriptional regulator [Celeribacter baekdonensis]|tara:strand:- start:24889 stop:25578 length:690 start_codon:yes stop_codon:yes gene_type:complete